MLKLPKLGFLEVSFIRKGAYNRKAAIAMAVPGVVAVLIAAFIVKSLPLEKDSVFVRQQALSIFILFIVLLDSESALLSLRWRSSTFFFMNADIVWFKGFIKSV